MLINLKQKKLCIGSKSVPVKLLYLSEKHFSDVMELWRERISVMSDGDVSILPYSLDDEFVYAFLAKRKGDQLELSTIFVDGIGYDDGQDSPINWMKEADKIISPEQNKAVNQREEPFGVFEFSSFLGAV